MHFDVLSIFIGLVVGAALILLYNSATGKNAKKEAQKILDEANNQAKNTVKQAVLDGKTQVYDLKLQAEKEIKEKRSEVLDHENKLQRREDSLNFRDENLTQKERKLDEKLRKADDKAAQLDKMEEELQSRIDGQIAILERVSNMSKEEARSELMEVVESKMADEVAAFIRDKEEEAKEMAAENAREIIATAIQRYSQDETLERTVSVVSLPSEEMKGRIIGREGRNIRAIENAICRLLAVTPQHVNRNRWGSSALHHPDAQGERQRGGASAGMGVETSEDTGQRMFDTQFLKIGVSGTLLELRPDIRLANHAMEEAFYNTQAARAAFFPTITLNGTGGWTNSAGSMVVNPGKLLLNAVASLTQPIFARGKLLTNLKISKLKEEDLKNKYVQTVINAGNQVNEALADCQAAREKHGYYHRQVEVLHEAYKGTHELMDNGKSNYLEVLTAQETLLNAQLSEAMNMYNGAKAVIALYIALGGATK